MSIAIAPIPGKPNKSLPLLVLLNLNGALRKTLLSRNFYQEVSDKVLTKASTIDATLYFVCYFALLSSSVLNNQPKILDFLQSQRLKLIKLIENSFGVNLSQSNNKWILALTKRHDYLANNDDSAVQRLSQRLKKIYGYIADVRIFNRLGDSIKYMPWVIDEFRAFMASGSPVSKFDRFINLLQSLNCLVLELLENAGWLTEHDWVGTNDNTFWCIETYIWCCRVWGVYILVEVLELFRRVPMSKWDRAWKINLFKQAIQLPLVLHWSLYDGCLTPFWVGLCGCGASWWGFKDVMSSLKL